MASDAKRQRIERTHALVSCFDEPNRLQEVDLRVLEPFQCRLFKMIKTDLPQKDSEGRLFWRCSMSRAMLQTFVRSLLHGELSLGSGVSFAEACTTFEFENVQIGVPMHLKSGAPAALRPPPAGIAFQKRREMLASLTQMLAEQVATAISTWPRLEDALQASLMSSQAEVSPTRAWIRFAHKPVLTTHVGGDLIVTLATKYPKWLQKSLLAIGMIHGKLTEDGIVDGQARNVDSYHLLAASVETNLLGPLFFARYDKSSDGHDEATSRRYTRARRFATEVRQLVLTAATAAANGESITRKPEDFFVANASAPADRVRFARACVSLADHLLQQAFSPASVYSGACAIDGASFERTQLAKALKVRGIGVLAWSDSSRAAMLSFPPGWGGVDGSLDAPAVLLDMSRV